MEYVRTACIKFSQRVRIGKGALINVLAQKNQVLSKIGKSVIASTDEFAEKPGEVLSVGIVMKHHRPSIRRFDVLLGKLTKKLS